ncbi:MAG TPA: acetate--CoA ligase family protein, partial [Acidimicrobiales bacterium]
DRPIGDANPVDLGLRAGAAEFEEAARLLVSDPGVDAVLVLYAPSLGATVDEAHAALGAGAAANPSVTVAACFYSPQPAAVASEARSIPVFDAIDVAARSLGRVATYAEWLAMPEGEPLELPAGEADAAHGQVGSALERGQAELTLDEAHELLSTIGLDTVPSRSATTLEEALAAAESVGYPVVLKAACRQPTAKTVAAGFALDLSDEAALRGAWERMSATLGDEMMPALVQSMLDPGVDVAITVKDHPQVGPVLTISPGGTATAFEPGDEVRVLPLGHLEVRRLVASARFAAFLEPEARKVLEQVLLRVGALVEAVPEIAGLRLNPVIVGRDRAVVTDAAVSVREIEQEPLPPIRRLELG